MKQGLIVRPPIKEKDLDNLVGIAHKNGCAYLSVITPRSQSAHLTIRVKRIIGFDRVEIDTFSCNWNISDRGQKCFMKLATDWPEDIKDPCCGKCIMRVYIKHDDKIMWGVGLWLARMLKFLENGEYLEEVKLS